MKRKTDFKFLALAIILAGFFSALQVYSECDGQDRNQFGKFCRVGINL